MSVPIFSQIKVDSPQKRHQRDLSMNIIVEEVDDFQMPGPY